MIPLFNTLKNKIKYWRRDKDFKSDISIPGVLDCTLLYTNDFDSYSDDIAYYFSSVYVLYQFDMDEDILKELINFYNVLNVYGINHRIYYNDKNTYLILEGSIDQYDDLVGLYYHHDRFECWMGNMYMNNFLSSLMRVINLIPIQNFKYADTEECRDIWNTFQANPISKYEKSKINEVINETYPDENIILLESDRVYETNKDIIQDDGLIDIIKGISCIRLAISANRISEMDGVLYSDSATNIYTKGNREFYLLKIHNDFLYSFTDEYNDKELVEDVLSVIPDGNKYKSKEENIDNDSYYSDIDEIIE